MKTMMGVMLSKGTPDAPSPIEDMTPLIKLVRDYVCALSHTLVGLAVMRALPGIPFAANYVNWSVIQGTSVYVNSYNIHDPATDTMIPVDSSGNPLPDDDIHKASTTDPRIEGADSNVMAALAAAKDGDRDALKVLLSVEEFTYNPF